MTIAVARPREGGDRITRAEYAAALRSMEESLRTGALDAAWETAALLRDARVVAGMGEVGTDVSLLAPILDGGISDPAAHAERLASAARALEEEEGPAAGAADPRLLARIAETQRPRTIPGGGTAGSIPLGPVVPESALSRIAAAWRAIADWIEEWLLKMWPREARDRREGGVTGPVIALMAAVVAALLFAAVRTLRRTTRAPEAEAVAELESARDENPLAREVSEWETRAAELARAGRYREAIRASYHAVLAVLFRSGRLHYEKGRTNWEYAARVPAGAAWNRPFVELVRGFEREWYGHDRSTAEAWKASALHSRRLVESLSARGEARG
jgi:hypothetical protein